MKVVTFLVWILSTQAFSADFTIGVISDLNGTECQTKYPSNSITAFQTMLAKTNPDHVIFSGDMVHGECPKYQGEEPYVSVVQKMWEEFDTQFFSKIATPISGAVAPGNHDAPDIGKSKKISTFQTENSEFVKFWTAKENTLKVKRITTIPGDNYPYYWAYLEKNVLFLVLHSTRVGKLSDGERQKPWIRALLNSPQAKSAKFRIAYGHVPPYPVLSPAVGKKYKEVLKKEQVGKPDALTDLLIDGGVSLLVVGHSHAPFPGRVTRTRDGKVLSILSMPCGHAPRILFSKQEIAPRGFARILVKEDGEWNLQISDWKTGIPIPYAYFPAEISFDDPAVKYEKIQQNQYY